MPVCPSVRSSALDPLPSPLSPFSGSKMNNPNQKEETQSPEALLRDRLGREDRRRRRLERDRARQLRDGEDSPALSPADLKALKAADDIEAQAIKGKRGAPSIRAKASRLRTAVGDALIARADARRADLRLAETIELDAAREGEPVAQVLEAKRGQGTKRLRTRDGLKLMHERGAFTPKDADGAARRDMVARIEAGHLLNVGLRYRDRFEIAQSSLKSCLDMSDGVKGSPTLWVQATAARRRAALANQVRVLEIAVAVRNGPEALEVLRLVAGEGRSIASLTASGHRRAAMTLILVDALRTVADALAMRS